MTTKIPSQPPVPLVIDQTFQQAIAHHQAGRLQEAGELYLAILQTDPNHPAANYHMGVLAVQMKQPAAGLPYFMAALDADPAHGQYWVSYIDALFQAGQLEDARQVLALARQQGLQGDEIEALALRPEGGAQAAGQPDAEDRQATMESLPGSPAVPQNSHNKPQTRPAKGKSAGKSIQRQGENPSPQETGALVALFNEGRFTEAATLAQDMTERYPLYGFGWKALGLMFQQMGRSADALAPMQKAAALSPNDAETHNNLGMVLQDLNRQDEAEASYRQALRINPNYVQAHINLGTILQDMGRLAEAEASYRRALQIKPDNAEAHYNLGNALKELGRLDEAEASYRQVLQAKPDYAEAHSNLGVTLHDLGRLGEAEASYCRALQIKPDYAEAHSNLGNTLRDLKRLNEAEASYRRALQLKPYLPEVHNNLGNTLQNLGRLDEAEACYRRALQINPGYEDAFGNMLFVLNYHPDKSGEEIFEAYREYGAKFGLPHQSEWRPHGNSHETQRRLKVGYVSPDFKRHSVRHFLEPLLAYHDKNALEVYAYAELTREDELTARYKGYVDHWFPTTGMSDEALAERIRADGIDILVELAGHTAKNRLGVFARKPAPVSLSWLGYGYTTGLTAIDYLLTDETSAPAGSENLFSEKPWRLATPGYVYRPAEGMGEVSPLPATSLGLITFGVLSRGIRINHRVIRVWSEILKRVKGARLVIDSGDFCDAHTQELLAEKFAAYGISRDRLQIGCHSPPWDVLRGIDIGLDCFPHNSGTTLFETLYMGVPYLTLAGRPSVGRLGSSILEGVGHPEWITGTEDEYVEKAVALAEDLPKLAALRAGLRQEMQTGPLMDEPAFARKVEAAYREMFGKWSGGLSTEMSQETNAGMNAGKLTVEQTLQQAIAHHQAGRLQETGELYLAILQTDPNHPAANYHMGVLAVQMKQPAAGLPYFMAALDADPAHGQYWVSYIDALFHASQLEDARQVLALARQQGLQGDEIEALALRLEGGAQAAGQPDAEDRQATMESLPGSPAVPQNSHNKPQTRPQTRPAKGKSAGKSIQRQGENPSPQETGALVALFNEGRFTEAASIAQEMTERFPLHGFGWKALGTAFQQMGRSADALAPMQKAVALQPGDAETHNNLGIILQGLGRLDEAEASYRRALQIKPDYAKAYCNLGAVLLHLGRLDEAEASLHRALAIEPGYAEAYCNLGFVLKDMGRLAEAERSYRKALAIKPYYADVYNYLGITLKGLGRSSEAEISYRQALALKPDHAETHSNLGNVLQVLGRIKEAEASYRQALAIEPDYAEAHCNLGLALKKMGRLGEAEASLQRALSVKPGFAEAHNNLGFILQEQNRLGEAETSYRLALAIKPGFAEAHNNLGNTLKLLGRLGEAEASLRQALQVKPGYVDALSNLGLVLQEQNRLDEAEATLRQALSLDPDFAEAHNNLGNALLLLGRLDEAEASLRRALSLKPDFTVAHDNLLFVLNYHPDLSAEEIYRAYQEYDVQRGIPLRSTWRAHDNDRSPDRCLRIGYVSPDFRRHSCGSFLEPLLAHHDQKRVEVYAYADLTMEDDMTARYKRYVEHWVPTKGMSDEALAERIRADGIDILVDLAGHTAGNRLLVFARKPAPVSLSWLGYGYTTGLTAIDYLLTDEASAPAGSERLFSEKPWRIAAPVYVYRPAADMGEVNGLPAQQRGYITFGTLTRSIRINHRTIRAWAGILKAVSNSCLVINSRNFSEMAMQEQLAARFAEYGITRDRLEIGYNSPPWDVLRGIDIGLDCFPHNSGTTLFETLYMGVPYITLAGRPSVGRLGSSILEGVGHPEWIAQTEDEYVEKAAALAEDLPKLAALRAGLRQEMQTGPLMDEPAFARKVEAAYREMFERWAEGLNPVKGQDASLSTGKLTAEQP